MARVGVQIQEDINNSPAFLKLKENEPVSHDPISACSRNYLFGYIQNLIMIVSDSIG
jgi:hypothetical protein